MGNKAQHSEEYKTLPKFFRELRETAGLTQRALGAIVGKPQSWVQYCETGSRRVDIAEFIQWAKACNVDPEKAFKSFLELT